MRSMNVAARAACLCGLVALAGAASGAVITPGTYRLHDHPDGALLPPPYGMRLDGLYPGSPIEFTMDFDGPGADMRMTVTPTSIHIFGTAFGGRDIGGTYAAEPTTGIYRIDMLYTVGVGMAGGDDDMIVIAPMGSNFGHVISPIGETIPLADKPAGGYNFRLGDEDSDAGHRGFSGISGWGWFTQGAGRPMVGTSDFIFTAELIPAPGMAMFGLAGLGVAATRRRR